MGWSFMQEVNFRYFNIDLIFHSSPSEISVWASNHRVKI